MTLSRRISTSLATGAALLAVVAPSASARLDNSLGTYDSSASRQVQVDRHLPSLSGPAVTPATTARGPIVIRTVEPSGFDWGAAGAGAAVGAALLLLGGVAVSRMHRRRVRLAA